MIKYLLVMFAVCSGLALSAQEVPGLGAPGADSSFSLGGGDEAAAPQITGQVAKDELRVTYVIPEGHHMVLQEDFVFIKLKTPGYQLGKTAYPAGRPSQDGGQEYVGTVVLTAPLQRTAEVAQAAKKLEISAGYQICDEAGTCLPPSEATVSVEVDPAVIAAPGSAKLGPETVPSSAVGPPAAGPEDQPGSPKLSLWMALLFAFIGGLILNAMPCVLPVLSIKALSLVESARKDSSELRRGALAYTAGVLTCFALLAGLVIGLKAAGEAVGWGFQFQNWKFVLALVAMIWLFALSLFEVFVISLPGQAAAAEASQKSGWLGAFLSGAVAVLLATPCTAPFLGSALGYAFSQPAPLILLFFMLIGLGLAFPFLLLGFFPGATRWIPRPGNWMTIFRELMAFLLLATVVWLADILRHLVGAGLVPVLWYLLVLALAAWVYGKAAFAMTSPGRWSLVLLALALAVAPLPWLNNSIAAAQAEMLKGEGQGDIDPESGFLKFTPERLEQVRKEGKPVFVDFGARWCATCRVNENQVLYTEVVRNAFKSHGVVAMRADYTNKDPLITEWLRKYQRAGVPMYLYYRSGAAEPEVLPELLTKDLVLERLAAPAAQTP